MTRIVQGATAVLLLIAALGLWTNFAVLRFLIMMCFLMMAMLAFSMGYRRQSALAALAAFVFSPLMPIHLPRYIWSMVDILTLAGMVYFTYWATNSYKKGVRFEQYVSGLFPEPDFVMIDRTRDTSKFLDRRVESDSHPDLIFRNQKTGSLFAVECKWRGQWARGTNGDLGLWWERGLSEKYAAFGQGRNMPVFVAFGIGGTPAKPREVYFLELERLHYRFLLQSLIQSGRRMF